MERPLYMVLARLIQARANCQKGFTKATPDDQAGRLDWYQRHTDRIHELVKEHLPSGSGFDSGSKINLDESTEEKLVFTTSFHHMDENGSYDGWTDHTITVTPNLAYRIGLKVTGKNQNEINTYIGDEFQLILNQKVKED